MCRRAVPAQPAGLGCHPRIGLGPPSANAGSPAPPARTARPEDFLRPVQRSFQVAPRAPPGPYATAPGPTPATRPGPPAASPGSPAAGASAAVQSIVQLVGRAAAHPGDQPLGTPSNPAHTRGRNDVSGQGSPG